MASTPSGTLTSVSAEHFENTCVQITFIPPESVTSLNLSHSAKAAYLISLTESGIRTDSKWPHPAKAARPIFRRLLGSLTLRKESHLEKAPDPISVNPSGNSKCLILLKQNTASPTTRNESGSLNVSMGQNLNDSRPISATPLGRTISLNL